MAFTLKLFGPPHMETGVGQLNLPVKHIALLAILADRHPKPVARDYLSTMLWPRSSVRSAKHSLSQALYRIRREVDDALLITDQSTVSLDGLNCDLMEFRTSIASGAQEKAASLYTGLFCEDLTLPGCLEFEQWLDRARQQTKQLASELLAEPLDDYVRQQLARTIGIPADAFPQVVDAGNIVASPGGFVGRIAERAAMEAAWSRSIQGEVVTTLVTGEPGIGKTTLCDRVVKKSVLHGSRALTAVAYEIQRNIPYGVISQLLSNALQPGKLLLFDSDWLNVICRALPTLDVTYDAASDMQVQPPAFPYTEVSNQLAGAVNHVFGRLASSRPLTIFVDDVQWADPASMSILHYVTHWDDTLPIFVVLASRIHDLDLLRQDGWSVPVTVPLQGLSVAESRAIIRGVHSQELVERDAEWIHELTAGNPLLIKAVLSRGTVEEAQLPQTVMRYFAGEIAKLSTEAQKIGATLSAVAEPLTVDKLKSVLETTDNELNSGLRELVSNGYVDARGSVFTLRHQLVREAFLDNLPPVASAQLHGRVARLLRDQGKPAVVVASQMTIAGNNAETCRYALEAARASQRLYAYKEAEHFYRIAIASASSTELDLNSRIALSSVLLRQGRSNDAEILLQEFRHVDDLSAEQAASLEAHILIAKLSEAGPASAAEAAFAQALELEPLLSPWIATRLFAAVAANAQYGRQGLLHKATMAMERPLSEMPTGPERLENELTRSALRATGALTSTNLGELDRLTAESRDWPSTYVTGLSAGGVVRVFKGQAVSAELRFLEALEICERFGLLSQRIRVLNNLGVCFLEQGRWKEADEQFAAVLRAAGSVAPKEIPSALTNCVISKFEQADFERVIALGTKYLKNSSLKVRLKLGTLSIMGLAHLELGQLSHARKCEREVRASAGYESGWSNDVSYIEMFLARMTIIDRRVDEAINRLEEQIAMFPAPYFYGNARMQVELLRILSTKDPDAALNRARELRPILAAAHAAPLSEEVDRLITRCSPEFRNQSR